MATEPLIRRARPHTPLMTTGGVRGRLGHPVAFIVTAAILLLLFGWTFFTNPDRPAAADDPAYYTWRTEALLESDPATLLTVDGPKDMYSGGYRVATPVLAGLMRRIASVGPLTPTIVIAVGLRVLIPLLLAGFAYRSRPDPLIWHAVAFGVASLLLTPPFAGYLDNVMTLFFLSASLYLIEPARRSWGPRIAFFGLLLVSGFTHPTTLAIFCLTLGAMAFVRFVSRGFSLRRVLADDGPMLASALAAAVATYATWKVGIWGESASLSEAALPPPAGADFFKVRLGDWISAMRPALNGPLFAIGAIGLLLAGRRSAEDEMTRVAIVWLAPLIGVFGFFAGVAYPYYRFFNTTTAWLLLIGVGAYFVLRYSLDVAKRGGVGVLALAGVLIVAAILGTNVTSSLDLTGWNDPSDAWIKPQERSDLDRVRAGLENQDANRPVVFVTDTDAEEPVRIYGYAKRVGNVSRYGVPGEMQGRTAFYLGSAQELLEGDAAGRAELENGSRSEYYAELSEASLADVRSVVGDDEPIVVTAEVFNEPGASVNEVPGARTVRFDGLDGDFGVHLPLMTESTLRRVAVALLGGALMLLPGLLLLRWALPDAGFMESLGLVPALSATLLTLVGMGVLAVGRNPLSSGAAWTTLIVSTVLSLIAFAVSLLGRGSALPRGSMSYPTAS